MASFNYNLYGNSIKFDYSFARGIKIRKSTKLSLNKAYNWNKKTQTVKFCLDEPGSRETNQHLIQIRTDFERGVAALMRDEIDISTNSLILLADKILGNTTEIKAAPKKNFLDLLEDYASADVSFTSPVSGKKISAITRRAYNSTLVRIKDFQRDEKFKIDFDTINRDFYSKFQKWCVDKNYTDNTHGKFIKNIKAVMNAGIELDFHNNLQFKRQFFQRSNNTADEIYLNELELDSLFKLKLTLDSIEDRVRDWFLIQANTGLRISDISRLTEENIVSIDDRYIITIETKKTKTKVAIPIRKQLMQILKKRGLKFPKSIHPNEINKHIKTLAAQAKITNRITTSKIVNGLKQERLVAKNEMIKSHTARRSFCTNAFLSGMDTTSIMNFSGHTKHEDFLKYIKADHLQKAKMLRNDRFFQ